jgi:hypothetical protein
MKRGPDDQHPAAKVMAQSGAVNDDRAPSLETRGIHRVVPLIARVAGTAIVNTEQRRENGVRRRTAMKFSV